MRKQFEHPDQHPALDADPIWSKRPAPGMNQAPSASQSPAVPARSISQSPSAQAPSAPSFWAGMKKDPAGSRRAMAGPDPAGSPKRRTRPIIWRHEEKYLLSEDAFLALYYQLRPVLTPDDHASQPDDPWQRPDSIQFAQPGETWHNRHNRPGTGDYPAESSQSSRSDQSSRSALLLPDFPSYHVRSLYWDTYEQHGLFEKLAGISQRHKYRIRIYNYGDQVIHLEKKMKLGDRVRKLSANMNRDQVDRLLAGDYTALLEIPGLGEEMYADIRTRLLAPRVLVDYLRIPLIWEPANVRITFDRHLATGIYRTDLFDPSAGLMPLLPDGQTILEVKYDRFMPDFIRDLLPLHGASLLAVSKYVLCTSASRLESWEDQQEL